MKNKLLNIFTFVGICALIGLFILLAVNVVQFGTLWFDYAVLGSILIIFLCLNLKFRRYTDYDETISCIRRTKKAIAKIRPDTDINYVKLLSVQNQLANAEIYLDDITARHDLYQLNELSTQLKSLRSHYKSEKELKVRLNQSDLKSDIAVFDNILAELKLIK